MNMQYTILTFQNCGQTYIPTLNDQAKYQNTKVQSEYLSSRLFSDGPVSSLRNGLNELILNAKIYSPDVHTYTNVYLLGGVKSACKDPSFALSVIIFAN